MKIMGESKRFIVMSPSKTYVKLIKKLISHLPTKQKDEEATNRIKCKCIDGLLHKTCFPKFI